jgi:hypothetical protein
MTQKAVAMANTYTFYGHDLCSYTITFLHGYALIRAAEDKDFLAAALQYPRDVFVAAEVLRCIPTALATPASWLVSRGHKASKHMFKKLVPLIEERLKSEKAFSKNTQVSYRSL